MLTEAQLAEFESNLKRGVGSRTVQLDVGNGAPPQMQTLLSPPKRTACSGDIS